MKIEQTYIESEEKNHKYLGWFYILETNTFYRWNDFIRITRQHGNS